MDKTNDKLPEEIVKAIKAEANEIYWQTHKISKERDPYCMGLTMFEVAQVPLIEALTVRQVKHDELQAQAQRMADALDSIGNGPFPITQKELEEWLLKTKSMARKVLQQWKDGMGKEEFAGSTFVSPAPGIAIGCISPEARELLDKVMGEWEKHFKALRETHGEKHEPTFYGFAYWLIRWSGLIQPILTNPQK